jgi:hypothetical protein
MAASGSAPDRGVGGPQSSQSVPAPGLHLDAVVASIAGEITFLVTLAIHQKIQLIRGAPRRP